MDKPDAPARVVWHTTESGDGDAAFKSVAEYLIKIGAEPHILYDPTTDRIGQFGPLNESARALKNDGSTRTNRVGRACIQIEVLARASNPFTAYWKPGPNFKALMESIRSWGVPDVFPMGTPAKTSTDCKRDRNKWLTTGGHYGHCNAPGNDHWDPGAIDTAALFAAVSKAPTAPSSGTTYKVKAGDSLSAIGRATGVPWETVASLNGLKPPYLLFPGQELKLKASTAAPAPKPAAKVPPFPGTQYFKAGADNGYVKQLGEALVRKGFGRYYSVGPGPRWSESDRKAVEAFQKAQGWTGASADGYPGPETWARLMK
ncbi:peptidoglycan-binding protein [Streptomyces sp. NPDC058440]|uniref:peptidoglycan-binding protein n=1 Tax=Streptomyces sp. NPDC058440 TaxID=3346501 RepID=UPI00365FBD3D